MSRNAVETVMGAVVLLVAGGFLAFAYNSSDMRPAEGYRVSAKFQNVGGLGLGSDVKIGGIKVGTVSGQTLDPNTFQAVVQLTLRPEVQLPDDSAASVASEGLLGGKFVDIVPGGSETNLAEGGEIRFTQSSVNLEELIGKMVFSDGGVDSGQKAPASGGESAPAGSLSQPQ